MCNDLKTLLTESISRNYSDNLLLSGGLDSSIVSSILHPKKTITIALSIQAPDLSYARLIADKYSEEHNELILTLSESFQVIENVVHILKTFDPIEIRNSSVTFAAIDFAKKNGYISVVTGDGADELFAGYNYLQKYYDDHAKLNYQLARLWSIMSFSSIKIGKNMGVTVLTPFLDKQFMQFAKSLTVDTKIGTRNGVKWGKFNLRQCFETDLGSRVAWRRKYAQEEGSGFTTIRNVLIHKFKSDLCENSDTVRIFDGVHIKDKEHLHYFQIYRKYFPLPIEEDCDGERCPDCYACLKDDSNYCHTCGRFPTSLLSK